MGDYTTHMESRRSKPRSSLAWYHTLERHTGIISQAPSSDYRFELKGSFSDSLSRQLDEGVRIGMIHHHGRVVGDSWPGRTVLLNRKDEQCY